MRTEGTLYRDMDLDDLIHVLQEQRARGVTRVAFGYGDVAVSNHVHILETNRTHMTDGTPTPPEIWGIVLLPHNHQWDEEPQEAKAI